MWHVGAVVRSIMRTVMRTVMPASLSSCGGSGL
jgi:hypothetical protein